MTFDNVTATALANVYFDGKVVSHTIHLSDGRKITLGLIYAGEYHFGTETGERMDITAGQCEVTLDGSADKAFYKAGSHFEVPAHSGFTIAVADGLCQYVCTFLS